MTGGKDGTVSKAKRAVKRSLVVVESPTKVKTIQKYLEPGYVVKASMGHVRDLPKSQLGVDPKQDFKPTLRDLAQQEEGPRRAEEGRREGRRALRGHRPRPGGRGDRLAPCPGARPSASVKVYRITFNEITERAVKAAFQHPGKIDLRKVDAQQARRVLDRLVGYKLCPLLWDKVQRGLSAGRVQSVAVRLIVDREREIEAFHPGRVLVASREPARPSARRVRRPPCARWTGEKAALPDEATTRGVMARLDGARYVVRAVTRGERRRTPAPPFITSTLQQEAGRKLGFTAGRR